MSCPPQYTMPAGYVLRATVTFQNTGTQSHAFDVVVAIGKGTNPMDFTTQAANMKQDVSTNPGETKTVDVDVGPLGSQLAGTWDVMVLVGDYNSTTGEFDLSRGDWLICTNALVIS